MAAAQDQPKAKAKTRNQLIEELIAANDKHDWNRAKEMFELIKEMDEKAESKRE